jgi:hypothetical protein|tara:strand:- start:301 stop:402 length:102 start_codon:yes stop_codon:yes gene_type:complete
MEVALVALLLTMVAVAVVPVLTVQMGHPVLMAV